MAAMIELFNNNLSVVFPKVETADYEKLVAQLETLITENEQLIAKKRTTPGELVELKDTDTIIAELDDAITEINKTIQGNNEIVDTKPDKQLECFNMVWEEIAFLLKDDVAAYKKSKADIEAEAKRLDGRVKTLQGEYRKLSGEINTLNASVINTAATVDSINAHLKDSGFEGFTLHEKEGVKGTYEVIREDGRVADHLSEGERNFIAFLYFYHVVRGSQSETDSGKDKIVIIDDPVSSMDSSALFIVSALVREMIGVCSNNVSGAAVRGNGTEYEGKYIQQLFILTHNAFFHREITYNQVSHYRYVSFFKVNKKNNVSTVEKCVKEATKVSEKDRNYNPVQNSYNALWREYETLDSPIPLMNVIRRILEYYFIQLCAVDNNVLSTTVLEAVKKKITEDAGGGVPDYTKYHLAQAMLSYINRSDAFNDGMYLTDYREYSLQDVITQLEPDLFKKVTGLDVKDFELLVSLNVFNEALMNDAVYKFKRYEDASLIYTGIDRHTGENVGLYSTVISRADYDAMAGQLSSSMQAESPRDDDVPERPIFTNISSYLDDEDEDEDDEPVLKVAEKPAKYEAKRTSIAQPSKPSYSSGSTYHPAYVPPTPVSMPAKKAVIKVDTSKIKAGTIVSHKAFGEGHVIGIDGAIVVVKFAGLGNKEKRFQFPGAFEQGFLKVEE